MELQLGLPIVDILLKTATKSWASLNDLESLLTTSKIKSVLCSLHSVRPSIGVVFLCFDSFQLFMIKMECFVALKSSDKVRIQLK